MPGMLLPLPQNADPGVYKCVPIRVPNDPGHREAFLGAVLQLARSYVWDDDGQGTNEVAAGVWLNIWLEVDDALAAAAAGVECQEVIALPPEMRVLNDQLQYSPDSGATWLDLYDLLSLKGAKGDQGIQGIQGAQGIQGIQGAQGLQGVPGNGFPPAPDTSSTLDSEICGGALYLVNYLDAKLDDVLDAADAVGNVAALVGNIIMLLASEADAVDAITELAQSILSTTTSVIRASRTVEAVEAAQSALYCAVKSSGGGFTPEVLYSWRDGLLSGGNPWNIALHLQSLAITDLAHQNRYFIGTLEPSSVCAAQFECDPVGEWCYTFDFVIDAQGWSAVSGERGVWTAAGWAGEYYDETSKSLVVIDIPVSAALTSVEMLYTKSAGSGANNYTGIRLANSSGTVAVNANSAVGYDQTISLTGSFVGHTACRLLVNTGDAAGSTLIKSCTIRGLGENPFGTDNC